MGSIDGLMDIAANRTYSHTVTEKILYSIKIKDIGVTVFVRLLLEKLSGAKPSVIKLMLFTDVFKARPHCLQCSALY